MKYLPDAVVDAELDIARAAYFGGEFAVYMTQRPVILLGQLDFTAAGAATWLANQGAAMRAAGDLQIVPITPINSAANVTVDLLAKDNSGTPVAVRARATFAPSSRAANQTANFARGFAKDMVLNPRVTHSTERAITSNVATITSVGHGYVTGQHVTTTLFGVSAYNVVDEAITVTDADHFTYSATHADEATTADTAGTITPVGIGLLFSEVTASQTPIVTNGGNRQSYRVYQLPDATDYELILASTEIDFNTKDRPAKGIDAGMESDFWVKRGKAMPGELTIGSKFRSFEEGMARYSGQKCTCMLVGVKEGQTLTDRLVFTQWVGAVKPKLPDGDGESTLESAGKYVDHLFFIAP